MLMVYLPLYFCTQYKISNWKNCKWCQKQNKKKSQSEETKQSSIMTSIKYDPDVEIIEQKI